MKRANSGKISIRDVAREVGVSITTVSRALNGYSDVSEKTKKKILEAVERLDYAPDANARSMGGKAEKTIALLTSELGKRDENGFLYGFINGMFQQCSDQGCEFMLLVTNAVKQEKLSFAQLCKKKNFNGVVVSGLRTDDPYYKEVLESDLPCALMDMKVSGKHKCSITIDNVRASREAVEYLIRSGHENIGMLNGKKMSDVSGERYGGYVAALLNAKIPLRLDYMRYGDFLEDTAFVQAKKLMEEHPEITALFCASDMMAIGAIRALEELGLRVPEDVSVLGFDDIPIAKYVYKGITTVRQFPIEMGRAGGEAVYKMLMGEPVESELQLPYELVVRGTTAKRR
ncbi:MAG: LacI family transcriptional regulator [Eubacterium sp.]|nr:LacI family transcriptional regulator [Eubacterium sp.]